MTSFMCKHTCGLVPCRVTNTKVINILHIYSYTVYIQIDFFNAFGCIFSAVTLHCTVTREQHLALHHSKLRLCSIQILL